MQMPKVRKLIKPDPRATAVLSEIGGGMTAQQLTQTELAKLAGMEQATLSRRLKDIGEMRFKEFWAIQDAIKRGKK